MGRPRSFRRMNLRLFTLLPVFFLLQTSLIHPQESWMKSSMTKLENKLVAKHGEGSRTRLLRGLKQIAEFWRAKDGNAQAHQDFVERNFAADAKTLDELFSRMQFALESLDGHMLEI